MAYSAHPKIDPQIMAAEIPLLKQGLTIAEVARRTGHSWSSVNGRNKAVYHIDVFQAYLDRFARDGIPSRLDIPDDFGYWFAGFFDGEGHFRFSSFQNKARKHRSYGMGVQLMLRDDDAPILSKIHEALGGFFRAFIPTTPNANPALVWGMHKTKDLAEIIIPLFDHYPLRSKKGLEYPIWRAGVIHRYTRSMGGNQHFRRRSPEERQLYDEITNMLKAIRKYKPQGGNNATHTPT